MSYISRHTAGLSSAALRSCLTAGLRALRGGGGVGQQGLQCVQQREVALTVERVDGRPPRGVVPGALPVRHPAGQALEGRPEARVLLGAPGVLRAGQLDVPAGVVASAAAAQGGAMGQQSQLCGVVVDGVEFFGASSPTRTTAGSRRKSCGSNLAARSE
jgi:hypothetical protein